MKILKKMIEKIELHAMITRQPIACTSSISKLPVLITPRSLSKIPTARQPHIPEKPKILIVPTGSSILYLFSSLPAAIEAHVAIAPMIVAELNPILLQDAEIATRPDSTD